MKIQKESSLPKNPRKKNYMASIATKTIQTIKMLLISLTPTPQNGQTHSNNSSAIADELFECVWPFMKGWR